MEEKTNVDRGIEHARRTLPFIELDQDSSKASDGTSLHFGAITTGPSRVTFVITCGFRQGPTGISISATKYFLAFRPQYAIMLGICAAVDKLMREAVVFSSRCYQVRAASCEF